MRTITIETLEPKRNAKRKRQVSARSHWKFWQWGLWRSRWFLIPAGTLGVLILIIGIIAAFTVPPMVAQAKVVMAEVEALKAAAKDQDLTAIESGLPGLEKELLVLEQQSETFGFVEGWPLIGDYYQDSQRVFEAAREGLAGGQIMVEAVEPYSAVLGFKSEAVLTDNKSSEDRIAELILLMPTILPALDEASIHFEKVYAAIEGIKAENYPGKIPFTDVNVQQMVADAKQQVEGVELAMHQARPVLEVLPSVLGAEEDKRYLIIFQNDKELRPTGGFMTSVAYVTFEQGRFEVSESNDIYSLDKNQAYLPTPVPMRLYNNATQLNLRDTNWSPDFVDSMEDFELYYNRGRNLPVDGFFTLDTQFVEELMNVTGPVTVPGYGEFTPELMEVNGAHVSKVVYELETIAQRSGLGNERKSVIGDLMKELIAKVMSEPVTRWPAYVELLLKMGQEKHVLLNFHDNEAQELAEDNNFAGRIVVVGAPIDYLHINDANLAGLKTNFYLQQKTKQDVTIAADGTVTKKLTITYTNTGSFDGWISATARNYTRVYVPKGSKLVSTTGGEQKVDVMEELDKTVFDNFVTVKPKASQTMTFTYTLPFKITSDEYELLMQKQPGAQNWNIGTTVNGASKDIVLDRDQTIKLPIEK
jgi:hypothetical protein